MKKVLVLSLFFVIMFSSVGYANAMSWQEFINEYPNDYIYRVDFPNGVVNYFSSPVELEFTLDDYYRGTWLESGKALYVYKAAPCIAYRLREDGEVRSFSGDYLDMIPDKSDKSVGYEGDIDIYTYSGSGFFLPERSTFLRGLVGPIPTILPIGFGIMSGVLLVKLLTGYFRSYLNRLL